MKVAWRFAFALMALFVISVAAPSEYLAHPNGTAVIDEAGILRPVARDSLNEILTTFDKNSTNQIMFISLKSLGGYSIEEIGVEQARALGIGQKGRDNGVLLLVAPHEHKVRIEVGYGLEGVLTDMRAKSIISNKILPYFRQEDYESGVISGISAIISTIEGSDIKFDPLNANAQQDPSNKDFAIFMVLFAVLLFAILSRRVTRHSRSDEDIISSADIINEIARSSRMRGGSSGDFGRFGGNGGFSGGGFSGGGGSFGGGGASGSW